MSLRHLSVFATAVLAVVPLCLATGLFLSHDVMPKVLVLMPAAALLLFFFPLWAEGLASSLRRKPGRIFAACVAAQAVSLVISTIFSVQPNLSFAGTVWRRFGLVEQSAVLVIALAVNAFATMDRQWVQTLFRAVSAGAALASIYGIAQYCGVDPFLDPALYRIDFLGGIVRPPATMGHADYFAAYLAPVALLCLWNASADESRRWRAVHTATGVLAATAILLSGTRGAVLAVAAGGVLLSIRGGVWKKVATTAGVLTVAAALLCLSPAGENFRHRLNQWWQDPGGPRMSVWRETPALVASHPFMGIGPETFAGEFRRIESESLSKAYPDFYHETPHNAFLDAASAQGIPGLLILICLVSVALRGSDPGVAAAVLAITVSSLFVSLTLVESLYLWCLAGVGGALTPALAGAARHVSKSWHLPGICLGAVFLIAAASLGMADAQYLRLGEAATAQNPAGVEEAWKTAVRWSLSMPGYELWASRQMALVARATVGTAGATQAAAASWARSAEAASLAEEQGEEKFSAAIQSCVLAIARGDLAQSERKARAAIALAPNWYKPHLLLGQILTATGRADEGTGELRRSLELGARAQ